MGSKLQYILATLLPLGLGSMSSCYSISTFVILSAVPSSATSPYATGRANPATEVGIPAFITAAPATVTAASALL